MVKSRLYGMECMSIWIISVKYIIALVYGIYKADLMMAKYVGIAN